MKVHVIISTFFVYLEDGNSVIVLDEEIPKGELETKQYTLNEGEFLYIPCKATHPDATVEIKRRSKGEFNIPLSVTLNCLKLALFF